MIAEINQLAREIEFLAPSMRKNGEREDNCEYPWEDEGGTVLISCLYTFPNFSGNERLVVKVIQLLRNAATESAQ